MAIRLTGTDTNGVAADANDDAWLTLAGEVVANTGAAFDFGTFTGVTYSVAGTVLSAGFATAVDSNSPGVLSNLTLLVTPTGVIQSSRNGVNLRGDGSQLVNEGSITGLGEDGVTIAGASADVTNHGLIQGSLGGLLLIGSGGVVKNYGSIVGTGTSSEGVRLQGNDVMLVNNGTITSGNIGVDNGFASRSDRIEIQNYGLIQAPADPNKFAIRGGTSDDIVLNHGQINGNVIFREGNDVFDFGTGTLLGSLDLGYDDDTVITGSAIPNALLLDGGFGHDVLDLSRLGSAVWADLAYSGAEIWTKDHTDLMTGTSSGPWRVLAEANGFEAIIGTIGVDLMRGNAADNTFGYVGDANIAGVETIGGRGGSDTVDFFRFGSAVWIDLLANGTGEAWTRDGETVETGNWRQLADLDSIENAWGTWGIDQFFGTDGDNTFTFIGATSYFNSSPEGPLTGVEIISGRGGTDTADFQHFGAGIWVDLQFSGTKAWTQDDGDATDSSGTWRKLADLVSVENVVGTSSSDELVGDGAANVLAAGAGFNTLTGRGGLDTFVFAGDANSDIITDFDTADGEKIDLRAAAGITDFADLVANHLTNFFGSAQITDANGYNVTLAGISTGLFGAGLAVSEDDFIFA